MSVLDRSTIIRGPAIVTFDSAVIYSEEDIVVTPDIPTEEVIVSMFGKIDERVSDILVNIELTPTQWKDLAVKFPHTTPVIGSSKFGATDKNLVIQTLAGKKLTYKAAALLQMPNISLSADPATRLFGPMRFQAIGANNEAWSAAEHRVAVATEAFSDTSFDDTKLYNQPYAVSWGAVSPWDDINTEAGVSIEFELTTEPVKVDSEGTVDATLGNLNIMARLIPVGVSEAQVNALLRIQDTGAVRGMSLAGNKNSLIASGTGVYVAVYNAAPKEGPLRFGRTILRAGELGFVATSSFTAGARDPMFYVGAAAP